MTKKQLEPLMKRIADLETQRLELNIRIDALKQAAGLLGEDEEVEYEEEETDEVCVHVGCLKTPKHFVSRGSACDDHKAALRHLR